MNITFLIGNGFDLQLGMETGYGAFLEWYVEQPTDDPDITTFREYLREEKGEWWSDAEVAMGKYLGNFSDETISVYFKNIRDFKLRLWEYLSDQDSKYDLENDPDVISMFRSFILKSADDIMLRTGLLRLNERRKDDHTIVHFVTFNYTGALDRIVKKIKEASPILETIKARGSNYNTVVGSIYHIHGSLDSSVVMGVDNLEQLVSDRITDFSKLSRTLVKPIVNDELGRNEHENAASVLNTSEYIFFYGLSLGITDKTWWDIIRNRLIGNVNCQVVIFVRDKEDDDIRAIIPEDILDFVNDKKDEFLSKLGIDPGSKQHETIRKRVFVIRNTKRLDISIKDRKVLANT